MQRTFATAPVAFDHAFAFAVARTPPELVRAWTTPDERAFAIERTAARAAVDWVAQVVQLSLLPVRLVPEYAQKAPVAHEPTALAVADGTSSRIPNSGQTTVESLATNPPGTASIA